MAKKKTAPVEVKVKVELGEVRRHEYGELVQEIKITPPLEVDFGHLMKIEDAHYAFPTKSRCPKCNTLGTRATSTQGAFQFRKCLRPSCRTAYKECGKAV